MNLDLDKDVSLLLLLPNEVSLSANVLQFTSNPAQLLQSIFIRITTSELLSLRAVNHRFCHVAERLIHQRLLTLARWDEWKLIIECSHPTRWVLENFNFCEYLGTPCLDLDRSAQSPNGGHSHAPGWLMTVFAHFLPLERLPLSPAATQDATGSQDTTTSELKVTRQINLESHENFSQMMFSASLVRMGSREGAFRALAEVIDKRTIRIFRRWLAEGASRETRSGQTPQSEPHDATQRKDQGHYGTQTVWVNESKTASFEVRVEELRGLRSQPILMDAAEERPAAFTMEIAGRYTSPS